MTDFNYITYPFKAGDLVRIKSPFRERYPDKYLIKEIRLVEDISFVVTIETIEGDADFADRYVELA